MTITEFLLARIDEDERMARTTLTSTTGVDGGVSWWWVRFGDNSLTWEASPVPPARVLRECEAKRHIVEVHQPDPRGRYCTGCQVYDEAGNPEYWCGTLPHLAAVYADHPDYDPAWAI